MNTLDDALATPVAGPMAGTAGRRCKLGHLIDSVPADTAARILDRLHADTSTGWTDDALSKALERGGHRVSPSLISRHRTGTCICQPGGDTDRKADT